MSVDNRFDVFLRYSSRDHVRVEVVARWLREQGLKVFQALGTCRAAAAVSVGSREMGDRQQREQYVALERGSIYGSSVRATSLSSLSWWRRSSASPSTEDTSDTLNATRATVSPYQGWLCFREKDALFFFGREAAGGRLLGAVKRRDLIAAGRASGRPTGGGGDH